MQHKLSNAIGSATPDPNKSDATAQPVPSPVVANKPPAGRKGPTGTQPRQTFSRVNTGVSPTPDAGTSSQKSQSPRGMEFLPAKKLAHQENSSMSSTTMMARPSLQDLVKEAMEGTASKVDISLEHARQLGGLYDDEEEKTASAPSDIDLTPDEYIDKVASALDFISKQAAPKDESPAGPGKGPATMEVLEATSSEENVDTGDSGQATNKNVPPQTPGTQSGPATGDPGTALQTNDEMQHPAQPADPMGNEKTSAALLERNLSRLGLTKEATGSTGDTGGASHEEHQEKKASSNLFEKNLARLGLHKIAEDAANPAKISGGTHDAAALPEGASASEEQVPSEPSDVSSQKSMISSNQAAIDYTKRQAKADPKSDVNKLLTEPALSKSTDKTLDKTLDHSSSAGPKIASDLTKTAAAQALLSKMAKELEDEKKKKSKDGKKEKDSQMGGDLNTPSAQSGFNAASMM